MRIVSSKHLGLGCTRNRVINAEAFRVLDLDCSWAGPTKSEKKSKTEAGFQMPSQNTCVVTLRGASSSRSVVTDSQILFFQFGRLLKMNKTDLINNISTKSGLTKKDVESVLNGFLGEITDALASGDKVQLIGFGTFETRKRSGRTGRNPQTGNEIVIPESTVPAFKAGNKLKEAVK